MKRYDCIVLGFGGVGSAALRSAALKGWKTLGIDRYGPAHDRGSSHGQTRVIREAYFEHPDYVPLLQEAFESWDELNRRYRTSPDMTQLIERTGVLTVGAAESKVVRGVLQAAQQYDLEHEVFAAEQIERRLPIFKIGPDEVGVFEKGGGYLRVEQCVAAMVGQAIKHGAEILSDTVVTRWAVAESGTVTVETDGQTFVTDRLIIAAGAWSESVLPCLHDRITVLKKQQHWFQLDRVDQKQVNDFPVFVFEQPDGGIYYGVPEINYLGMKVCRHSGGQPISDPTAMDRSLDADELEAVGAFMDNRMHFGRKRLVHHSSCLYTTTTDGNFIVDQVPGHDNVVFAAGLSGHGFKFTPVIGNYLVELLEGERRKEFDFLRSVS